MLTIECSDRVATIRMEHGKVNAMDLEFCQALTGAMMDLAHRDDVGAMILIGNPRVFSAGVDLKRLVREPLSYVGDFVPSISALFMACLRFPKPMISAISGHALAGGCVVASAADYRLLAADARIGMPELRVGLALPAEGIEIFRYVVAPQFLQRVVISGIAFCGEEALSAGLADEVLPHGGLESRAQELANQYLQIPASVFRLTKEQIRQPVLERIAANNREFQDRIRALWCDPEVRTSVERYVAERL